MAQIGIKLANHDFFPIIDEDGKLPIEKELELTTVRDDQESVQINLFKSDGKFEPTYVGSLIIEDLNKKSSGEATILLKLSLDENKNLNAEAIDKDSGNKQSLSIPINETEHFSAIDFDTKDFEGDVGSINVSNFDSSFDDDFAFEKNEDSTLDIGEDEKTFSFDEERDIEKSDDESRLDESYSINQDNLDTTEENIEKKRSGFPIWLTIFLIILILGLLALVVALFLKNRGREPNDEMETIEVIQQDNLLQTEEKKQEELTIDELTTEAPKKEAEPFPVKKETSLNKVETSIPNEEVKKKEEVKVVKDGSIRKAVRYRIRWGDTLWDISGNFYKNPWAYKRIARYNKIKNPNKIIAGTYITIPAK